MGRRVGVAGREHLDAADRAGQRVVVAVRAAAGGRQHPAHLAVPAGRRHAGREGLRGVVAHQPLDPLAPPLPERGAHPLGRARRVPSAIRRRSMVTTTAGQPRPTPARRRRRRARPPRLGAGEHRRRRRTRRPGGPAPPRRSRQVLVLGAEQVVAATRRRRLRSRSSSRFWSSPRARLTVRRELGRDRCEQLVAPGDEGVVGPRRAPRLRRHGIGLRRPRLRRPRRPRRRRGLGGRADQPHSSAALRRVAAGASAARRLPVGPGPDARRTARRPTGVRRAAPRRRSAGSPSGLLPARCGRGRGGRHLAAVAVAARVLVVQASSARAAGPGRRRPAPRPGRRRRCGRGAPGCRRPVAHPVDRRRHLVAGRPQLLDLDPERAAPRRQVGQDPPARLLDLLEQRPALVLGPGDHRLAFGHGVGEMRSLSARASCSALATNSSTSATRSAADASVRAWSSSTWLCASRSSVGGPLLGLGDDPGRLLVGVAQDLGAVLAQRGRQRRLVDHRVGGPLLGLGQGRPELLLVLLERLDAPGHRLEVGPHLVGVEAPPDDGEGVAGDVARSRSGTEEMGARPSGMARAYGAAWAGTGLTGGHVAPEALAGCAAPGRGCDGVDVELRGRLGLGRRAARPAARRRRWPRPARPRWSSRPRRRRRRRCRSGRSCPVAATIRLPGQAAAGQLVDDAERHGQAGGGPADVRVCTVTLTGKCQSCWVWGRCRGTRSAWSAGRTRCRPAPLGGVPSVTDLCTVGPGTKSPSSLMEDSSTLERRRSVPGVEPVQRVDQGAVVGVGGAVHRGDDLGHLERLGGRRAGRDPVDERAGVRRAHRVAEVGQRRRRGGRLGLRHLEVALVEVLVLGRRRAEQLGARDHSLSESK